MIAFHRRADPSRGAPPPRRWKTALWLLITLLAGVVIGGYVFSDSQPRSLLAVTQCSGNCYKPKDIAGLAASIGIQKLPEAVPFVVSESDQCVAVRPPYRSPRLHFVLFPKRDIRNIGDVSHGDEPYIMGCLAMVRELTRQYHLTSYRVYSNGPDKQDITYLHFHLVEERAQPDCGEDGCDQEPGPDEPPKTSSALRWPSLGKLAVLVYDQCIAAYRRGFLQVKAWQSTERRLQRPRIPSDAAGA